MLITVIRAGQITVVSYLLVNTVSQIRSL